MVRITGTAHTVQAVQVTGTVTPAEAFFEAAQALMPGARVLADSHAISGMAFTFVAGHILECLLKSCLSNSGISEDELRTKFGHDLCAAWNRAMDKGLSVSPALPAWACHLNDMHNKPFVLRYPMGLNGFVFPPIQTTISGLEQLLDVVRQYIRK